MNKVSEKEALALVFGVMRRDGILSGVPGFVPGLAQKLDCKTCEVKLARGLPVEFVDHMTDQQKDQFKQLTGYKQRRTRKTLSAIPTDTTEVENTKED